MYPNEEELAQNECEDQIPHLDDILKASFVSVSSTIACIEEFQNYFESCKALHIDHYIVMSLYIMFIIIIIQPHESHYAHVLSRVDRDCVNDHRFEPVAVQRAKIRSRHRQRKKRYSYKFLWSCFFLVHLLSTIHSTSDMQQHITVKYTFFCNHISSHTISS